ncbi:MAG: SLBB domain-containing protein [Bacteroidetes bacterium]|nr:SLBB domain-containing protein [Bacteroidota bacterium]
MRAIAAYLFVIVVLGSASLQAQILDDGSLLNRPSFANQGGSYYNFSAGSGCDLMVSVWGYVGNPGRYRVPCETNLLDLLSYCGGPLTRGGTEAYLYRIKIVRKGGADRENEIAEVFELDLEKYLELRDVPTVTSELLLFPGDLIIVDGQEQSNMVLRIAQIIVAIASIVTSTVAVINLTK